MNIISLEIEFIHQNLVKKIKFLRNMSRQFVFGQLSDHEIDEEVNNLIEKTFFHERGKPQFSIFSSK